jgi:crotonobetainyl-CoA:carnitine CoA-transferase CaiB-like acyl-CoA transferase
VFSGHLRSPNHPLLSTLQQSRLSGNEQYDERNSHLSNWPKLEWDGERTGPLRGIKVVDMSTVVLGPFATLQLADLGAEVIKVENREGAGDIMRKAGDSPTGDLGPIYAALNRNKKSVALNAAQPEDKAALLALIAHADVFFHNVRMAGMERLGLGYEAVKAVNPDIVYVHCAGYGADGPYAKRQAYDDLIQAASGFSALTEQRDGQRPQYAPSLVADKVCGLFAANAVMAALLARSNGLGGQFVQVPMFESFTWFNMVENLWGETFVPGNGRIGYTRSVNPRRRPYPTKDGYIAIVPYADHQWERFFELAGRPGVFEDPRFSTYQARTENTAELYATIEECMSAKTTDEWLKLLDENNIAAMRYNRLPDVMADPHLQAVGFFEEREANGYRYRTMKHPVHYSATPASIYADPPGLDADRDEVLGK